MSQFNLFVFDCLLQPLVVFIVVQIEPANQIIVSATLLPWPDPVETPHKQQRGGNGKHDNDDILEGVLALLVVSLHSGPTTYTLVGPFEQTIFRVQEGRSRAEIVVRYQMILLTTGQ